MFSYARIDDVLGLYSFRRRYAIFLVDCAFCLWGGNKKRKKEEVDDGMDFSFFFCLVRAVGFDICAYGHVIN